jgi:surface antigen
MKEPIMIKTTNIIIHPICSLLVAMLLMIAIPPPLVQAAPPVAGFGTALNFDGVDDFVSAPLITSSLTNVTIEAWIKTNDLNAPNKGQLVHNKGNGGGNKEIYFQLNNGLLKVYRWGDGNGTIAEYNGLTTDTWYHVAAVFTPSQEFLYVNGNLVASTTGHSHPNMGSTSWDISAYRGSSSLYDGLIDEVRIWNTIRTQTEIQANMSTTLQGNESNLVGYWPFDENTGTTTGDRSSNANDGTLNNMDAADWLTSDIPITFTTPEDTALSDTLLGYDTDGDTLTYSMVSNGSNGNVVITNTGAFTYTPDTNFNGTDTFTYQVNDGTSNSNIATVTINITSVEDVPEASNVNISGTTTVGETLTGNYTYTDAESDPEGTSTFQWYTASDATCTTNQTAISGATSQTYVSTTSEVNKYICFEITPIASSGASPGIAVLTTTSNPISKKDQTISFGALSDKTYGNPDFAISATASSSLAVSFSASDQCTVSGNTVTLSRSGRCTITATQGGDDTYNQAPDVSQSFNIVPPPPPIPSYKLTVESVGGAITGEGINCGSDCQQYFEQGTLITLTATPYTNSIFESWDSDCDNEGTVIMNSDKSCSATFTKQYTLTITTEGQGTIDNCGTECTQTHLNGETVQLSTTSPDGWQLESWTGACENEGTVIMNSNKSCTAIFKQSFDLTVTIIGKGTVSTTDDFLHCSESCTVNYSKEATVIFNTQPDTGWVLESLTGHCNAEDDLQMTSDKTCVVTFIEDANIPNNGDGNGDGLKDSQQSHVVSLPDLVAGDYLTLEVEPTCSIVDVYTDKPENQAQYNEAQEFPQGIIYFELDCAETDATIYFHALQDAINPMIQKYGTITPGDINTLGWFTVPDATFETKMIGGQTVVAGTYHLIDGELGDNSGVDGRIIDPAGLTFNTDSMNNMISLIADEISASTQLGYVNIPVNRLVGNEGAISVDYTTQNGSAIAGQDYQATSGTLNWADGDKTSKIITINLLGGATAGNTLSLTFSNLTPSANAILVLDNTTITITNEPLLEVAENQPEQPLSGETLPNGETSSEQAGPESPSAENPEPGATISNPTGDSLPINTVLGDNIISFLSSGFIANKNEGTATITITRNGTQGIVSIDYTTINGTAIADQDYQSASGTLTWANGEEGLKSFEVALLDTATLGNSLILSLGNLSDAEGQFDRDIAVLTILDEIAPPNTANEQTATTTTTSSEVEITESTSDTTGTGTIAPTIVVSTDVRASDVGNTFDKVFKAKGNIFREKTFITEQGSVSNAIFDAEVESRGLIANSTFTENAVLNGGTLSGNIKNDGLIQNVNFVGMSLTGGILSGNVTNNSQIGGIIQGVKLAPGTILTGGKIGGQIKATPDSTLQNVQLTAGTRVNGGLFAGEISGDPDNPDNPNNPPIITAANIAPSTVLSNVRISPSVDLPANIVLGTGVILPGEPPILEDFGYKAADIANLDAESLAELEPGVFATLKAEHLESISTEAMTTLSAEQLAEMQAETLEYLSLEQLEQIPVETLGGLTEDNIEGMPTELMGELSGEQLAEIKPEALAGLEEEQLEAIPPEAMSEMVPEQMAELPKETLEGLSTEQLEQLPTEALSGLQSDNMGGLSTEVLNNFTPEHLSALDAGEFTQMPTEEVSKFFTHFDADKISIQNVYELVPPGWQIDTQSGEITAPEGAKITPRTLPVSDNLAAVKVKLPPIADLGKGMGLGGQGTSVKDNMTRSLEEENLMDFVLSQNEETGILWVEGTGDSEGVKYTFIPDVDNVIQVDGDKIPVGLSVSEGGFYTITTPDEKQYKVVPAPQNPLALSEVIGDGQVVVGKRGDVLMEWNTEVRRRGARHVVAIFDPFIQPAPEGLCQGEISLEEMVCDFDNASENQKLGLHFPGTRRTRRNETAKVVYPDGTAQTITPTLLDPDVFMEQGFKFEGVEDIVFNANGVFYASYQGQPYLVIANFDVQTQEVLEGETPPEPSITVNPNGSLTYQISIETSEETEATRRRGARHQTLIFNPIIEMAPDELCTEQLTGNVVEESELICDFDKVPW